MSEIQSETIRRIINAGIESKKQDPLSDLTPLSYKNLKAYIISCESTIINMGGELPKVFH